MTVSYIPERLLGSDYMPPSTEVIVERELVKREFETVHWHDFHKLVYLAGGSGTHVMNGVPFAVKPGVAFLLTPSDFHAWRPSAEGCAVYNILFSPRVLSEYLGGVLFDASAPARGALVARGLDPIQTVLDTMVRETDRIGPDARLSLECLLQHVLVEFVRRADVDESAGSCQGSAIHEGVRVGLSYMEQHYRDPLTLGLVAANAHMSPNYFSQLFHEYVGVTFQEHLSVLRSRFAQSLLRATEMSVTDVCHAAGFRTLSHFERTFKAHYGTPPSAWRRDVRLNGDRPDGRASGDSKVLEANRPMVQKIRRT